MIKYVTGSIFDSSADCITNPVNCVGVMGGGLALDFKLRYPDMYRWYKKACAKNELHLGNIAFWACTGEPERKQCICLFPTKYHYRELSTVSSIDVGLKKFCEYAPMMKIQTVAFPKLGCGLGGLNFERQIQPLFERYFVDSSLQVEVYV